MDFSSTPPCKKICEDKEANNATTNSLPVLAEGEGDDVPSAFVTLPPEMFHQVFHNVGKKSLKNSREVCSIWRNAIDGNSKLMKTLTFTIDDIKQFMDSQLVSKVKSVRFIQPLKGTTKSMEDLFKKIGSTVEEVFFTFRGHVRGRRENARKKLMFAMMLRYCTKLSNLTTSVVDNDYDFIKNCTEDPRNSLVLSSIQSLSINVRTAYLEDFRKLVLALPNLRRLHLVCDNMDSLPSRLSFFGNDNGETQQQMAQKIFPNIILDHLGKYNGKLQEIWLEDIDDLDGINLIKLFLHVGELYPNPNPVIKCKPNLLDLLRFEKSNDTSIQVTKNSCRAIQSGLLEVGESIIEENLETSSIGLCSNISTLDIEIDMRIPLVDFQFISELKKLENLKVKDRRFGNTEEDDDSYLTEVLSCGIPSVKRLEFDSDSCRLAGEDSISFHLCFPNLTKLYIKNYCLDLSADFIYNLTNLDKLKSLGLEHIVELADEHLTRVYDCVEEDGKISNLPAIAGFKSLRSLHIAECMKLTDDCLVNGLALCTKLEKIKLCYVQRGRGKELPGNFTKTGLNFLQKARNFLVEDQDPTSSHVRCHMENSDGIYSDDVFKRFKISK